VCEFLFVCQGVYACVRVCVCVYISSALLSCFFSGQVYAMLGRLISRCEAFLWLFMQHAPFVVRFMMMRMIMVMIMMMDDRSFI